jgi:hypothetical protein
MRQSKGCSLGWVLLALAWSGGALAEAPRVKEARPDDGDRDVNPSLREIRVTFDQAMGAGFSFTGSGENFPEVTGKPKWVSDTTCVLPVKLKPDHEYQLGINSQSFKNFKNKKGEPAVPYPLRFKTSPAKGKVETLSPEENRKAVGELRRAVDENYSYRDLRKVDWPSAFKTAEPKLLASQSPRDFAREAARLLGPAQDLHLWVKVGDTTIPTFQRHVEANINPGLLAKLVPGWSKKSSIVATGRFEGDIGYILIDSWSREYGLELEPAYELLGESPPLSALIVDVRPNGGGDERLARAFAGCFLDQQRVYAKHVIRHSGSFSRVSERTVAPNRGRPGFRGRVAVLMGSANMSSCESFLLMMKQVPSCTLVGERSYGSSGNPQPQDLGNGVTVFVPSWKDLRADCTCFEGEGIAPDVKVKAEPSDFTSKDPVLAAALALLRKP